MTKEAHIALFKEFVNKSEEELNEIINTGMFNSIIEGYLIITLKGLGASNEDIKKARIELKAVLDETTAGEARQATESNY